MLDAIFGIGHSLAPFRVFGDGLNLGRLQVRCPLNSRDEMARREMGGAGNYVVLIVVNLLASMVISFGLTVPLIKALQIRNGSPEAIAILIVGWLFVSAVGFVGIVALRKMLVPDRTWEFNLYEFGLELKTPKIHLRAHYAQIADIHFGTKIAAIENTALMWLYLNPLYIGIIKNISTNVLTVRLIDHKIFRLPNAKAVFQDGAANALVQRCLDARRLPPVGAWPPSVR